ncbi:MAG: leucine-rich repeat domain-containing protein [Clostridia bacterium]|nr:leucine-rich repeat domain-containing protein [Clostridia bacterium]
MRKMHVLIVVLIAILTLGVQTAFADERATSGKAGDDVTWFFDETTATLTFSGTGRLESRYTTSREEWYSWSEEIKYVVVEEGIEDLYGSVFCRLEKMEQVSLPSTLKCIGDGAFLHCYGIKEVVVPEGVTIIDNSAFKFCKSLERISLPDSLETIGHNAFTGCTSLRSISIPDKVKLVRMSSFADCTGLVCITFGKGVESVDSMTQTSESRIRTLIFTGSAPKIDDIFLYRVTATIYYPEGDSSWDNWFNVNDLGNTVKLVPVKDPSAIVPNLDLDVYEGFCGQDAYWSLKDGELRITGKGSITSAPWHFIGKEVKKIVIEDGITSIDGTYIFYTCRNVEEIYISNSMESIVSSAFEGSGIKSIVIPGSLKVIPSETFSNCSKLETVVILDGVVSIGERAFSFCENLVSIELPNSLERIEDAAFMGCSSLKTLIIPPNIKFMGEKSLAGTRSLEHIYFTGEKPEVSPYITYSYSGFTVHIPSYVESWKLYREGEYHSIGGIIYVVKYDCQHSYGVWTKADGDNHTRKCLNCGYVASEEHSWTEKSIDKTPTCTEAGSKTMNCKTCGAVKTETIDPPGHAVDRSLNYEQSDTHHWKICLDCGGKVDEQEHQGEEECEVCRYKPEPTPTPEPTATPTPTAEPTQEPTATSEPGDENVVVTPTAEPNQEVEEPKPKENGKVWVYVVGGAILAGAAITVPIVLKKK